MKANLLKDYIKAQILEMREEEETPAFIWADDPDTGMPITDKNGSSVGYWETNPNVYWTWDGKELKIADMGD